MRKEFDYYHDTNPEEFLADLRAILINDDNMLPVRLIEDINWMTRQYINAHLEETEEE